MSHWYLKYLNFSFLIFVLILSTCQENKTPTEITLNRSEITLSLAEAPRLREIRLKVDLSNVELPQNIQLSRNDSIILNGQMTTNVSILKDTGLTPATEYRYRAYLLQNGVVADTSNLLQVHTMDTTSHNYVWTIDTIGTIGSTLLDVFAISENDVWAVGNIDTGANQPFNAMHWDGTDWELKRIPFTGWCSAVEFPSIRSIFAFSENDIWFARGGSLVHYNGSNFYNDCDMNHLLDGSINRIWATNPNNLYAIGEIGSIVHYNGSSWQKIESGTQLNLTDIWGFPDGLIYIVGSNTSTLENIFLIYDNGQFERFEDATRRKKGVWGTAPDNLYLVGDGVFTYNGESLNFIQLPPEIPNYHMESIRGTAENNIFAVGHFGFVAHYNGSTWRYYPELYRYAIASSVAVIGNSVFVVGTDGSQAFIYVGRRMG